MINVEQLLNLSVRLAAPVILICLGGLFSIKGISSTSRSRASPSLGASPPWSGPI